VAEVRSGTVAERRLYNSVSEEFSVYTHSAAASRTRSRRVSRRRRVGKRSATTIMRGGNRVTVIYEVIIIINVIITV